MDLDTPMGMAPMAGGTARTGATILCCNCGVPIDGTSSAGALCYDWYVYFLSLGMSKYTRLTPS